MNLYIDESGSMKYNPKQQSERFFFLGIVITNNEKAARQRFKNFIRNNKKDLMQSDKDKKHVFRMRDLNRGRKHVAKPGMYNNGNFIELKGSHMTYELKEKFLNYITKDGVCTLLLVKVDNRGVSTNLYSNTARAYNYLLKTTLLTCKEDGVIKKGILEINCDETNVATEARKSLEDYLVQELVFNGHYENISVCYHQSENERMVQVADVIANSHYSSAFNPKYKELLKSLTENGSIIYNNPFFFPKF